MAHLISGGMRRVVSARRCGVSGRNTVWMDRPIGGGMMRAVSVRRSGASPGRNTVWVNRLFGPGMPRVVSVRRDGVSTVCPWIRLLVAVNRSQIGKVPPAVIEP